MTREEAFNFYRKLLITGELEKFREKRPDNMTEEERELFYYDDGECMYNPFVGKMDSVNPDSEVTHTLSIDQLKAIGMLRGMKYDEERSV